jgi:putative hemolysin
LIVANGLLAMSEMALVSARRARLQQRAEAGNASARVALELAQRPDRFLSTTQIGITLVGILAGAFGGATVARTVAGWLEPLPGIGRYSGAIAAVLTVAAITYLSLVIGELVPKRLALQNPERIAVAVARPMRSLSGLASPLVDLLAASSDVVLRLLGSRRSDEPPVTEEEVLLLLRQGAQAGVFAEVEQELVDAVFRLGDRRAGELMTPRHRVVYLDLEDPEDENRAKMADAPHSRFPVCVGGLDQVVGVVSVKTIWSATSGGALPAVADLRSYVTPPIFLPEALPAFKVLEHFRDAPAPLALVVDEYGGVTGLITLHDLMEALVGDLAPAGGPGDEPAVRRPDGSWLLDGAILVDELSELLDLPPLPEDEEGVYQTLGGLVMTRLSRIPAAGDAVVWAGWRFEVVDMDGNRVDKVLATRIAPGERAPAAPSDASPSGTAPID